MPTSPALLISGVQENRPCTSSGTQDLSSLENDVNFGNGSTTDWDGYGRLYLFTKAQLESMNILT